MQRWLGRCACLLLGMAALARAEGTADVSMQNEVNRYLKDAPARPEDPSTFRAFWKEGLRFETADKVFSLRVGGRVMADVFFKNGDEDLDANYSDGSDDGVRFRRARLHIQGTVYKNVEFSAEFEFATASPELRDVYVGLKGVPGVGNIRFGHFKEPMGLEELTSSRFISFMERPSAIQAFAPAFDFGLMIFNNQLEERMTWAIGIFKDQAKEKEGAVRNEDGAYAATLRVTGLIIDNKEDQVLLHIGAAFRYSDPSGGKRAFEARPSVSTGAKFVSASVVADKISVFGFELAGAWKALHAQAELLLSDASADGGAAEPSFMGYYVQVGYFLTREHRPYARASGRWDRVKPAKNFHDGSGGWGAWEVLLRWSSVDCSDAGVNGGEMDDLAFGVNWYMNPNVRVMFNFVWADIDGTKGPGELTVLQMRWQIDF